MRKFAISLVLFSAYVIGLAFVIARFNVILILYGLGLLLLFASVLVMKDMFTKDVVKSRKKFSKEFSNGPKDGITKSSNEQD